jgi:hypothetical protein
MKFNPRFLFVALLSDFSTMLQHDGNLRRPEIIQRDPKLGNLPLRYERKTHEVGKERFGRGRWPSLESSWRRRLSVLLPHSTRTKKSRDRHQSLIFLIFYILEGTGTIMYMKS